MLCQTLFDASPMSTLIFIIRQARETARKNKQMQFHV